mmetsp:Transcript_43849/g.115971  ORF Transcript_43849/g.115971 Transcript_43849/m.115971 type:complete len:969 (+) Transcript_43849:2-2908(+)
MDSSSVRHSRLRERTLEQLDAFRRESMLLREELRQPEPRPVPSDVAFQEERQANDLRFRRLADFGVRPKPFSVAFSGGGVRAAAFQCGVIWRLAAAGRLRDIEHLSLVSGGSYVGTALVTFILNALKECEEMLPNLHEVFEEAVRSSADVKGVRAEPPASSAGPVIGDLDTWYLKVTWRLIERMQSNAGFLVRFSTQPFKRKGSRPPVHGLIVFVAIVVFAFAVLPVMNFVFVTIPMVLLLDGVAGAAIRRAWCESSDPLLTWTYRNCYYILGLMLSAAILHLPMKIIKSADKKCGASEGHEKFVSAKSSDTGRDWAWWRTGCLMVLLSLQSIALRISGFLAMLVFLAWAPLGLQVLDSRGGDLRCERYDYNTAPEASFEGLRCVDYMNQEYFSFVEVTNGDPYQHDPFASSSFWPHIWPTWLAVNFIIIGFSLLGSCLKWQILFLRGNNIASLLSPMWVVFAASMIARWRIFGPLEHSTFNENWQKVMNVVLCMAVLALPLYGQMRQVVHLYYRRSLRRAFYHNGEDVNLADAQGVAQCPNVIVAATLVDYCRPSNFSDVPHFSEFFFTPQRMGGERTGYIRLPGNLSMSRMMAISGAATDAFLLTKMNAIWVRLTLLALFNLFMGDYIEFKSKSTDAKWRGRLQAFSVNVVFVVFFVTLYYSDRFAFIPEDNLSLCQPYFAVFWTGWGLLGTVIAASFFAGLAPFRWILSSTTIRHLHMAMMHYHTSDEPPLRLFLNDGGLVECLGLISLLRRRSEYMLVTDATADFKMELVCLRETMRLAERERICTFFDPDDPRRGAEPRLQEFSRSQDKYLRLGVLYDAWNPEGGEHRKTGEVFFIRMRLLAFGRRMKAPRISEEEVMMSAARCRTSSGEETPGRPEAMLREEVGGCCCDCCHKKCNCGLVGRFPDISSGNQFLTPTQFSLLCRLGYEISGEAIDHITDLQSETRQHGTRPPLFGREEKVHSL